MMAKPTSSLRSRLAIGSVISATMAAVAVAQSGQTPSPAKPVFENGQAQIVPAFQDQTQWIRQSLWVESEFDSDGDGKRDRMFTDVTRPAQTGSEGLKVPVIYESSPYYAGTSGARGSLWNVNQEVGEVPPPRQSQAAIVFQPERARVARANDNLENTWVPRGFAVVHSDAPGTGRSQGCPTVGDAPERLAPKAIIDWLNGRAKGYKTIDGTEQVVATAWATGKVGMTGTSYNGTIPVAAATTGVDGLTAIIPVAPNTSYYHYYRSNGLVRHPDGWLGEDIDFLYDFINSGDPARRDYCNATYRDGEFVKGRDRQTGDYNAFWAKRDLLPFTNGIKAAVLMAHAFNDYNVVPEHSFRIYNALKGRVPLQAYYHQGGHGGNPPMEMMNKWFTRYLYGIENGVEKDPKGWVVRENAPPPSPSPSPTTTPAAPGRGRGGAPPPPTPYGDFPNPAAVPVAFRLTAGGTTQGGLVTTAPSKQGSEKLYDDVTFTAAALAANPDSQNRLIYATPELTAPVHLSGVARMTIRLAASKAAANLSVWLVQLPWPEGQGGNANVITRGWADPQNAASLTKGGDYNAQTRGTPLEAGKFVTLTFDLQPDDQIVPIGKRIGLLIMSSDRGFTLWPKPGTELTVDLDGTSISLPVVGGAAAFAKAIAR